MKKLLFSAIVAITFFAGSVYAGSVKTNFGTISQYTVSSTGTFIISSTVQGTNPSSCTSAAWYALSTDHVAQKSLIAVLLTAQAVGQNVKFYISDNPGDCVGNYPKIVQILVET